MDTLHRNPPASTADRLQAFRQTAETPNAGRRLATRKNEVLIGVIVVLVGLLLVSFVVFQPEKNQVVVGPTPSVEQSPANSESQLLAGEALIALSVQSGHFPPQLAVGDVVRIAVTPGIDGNGETRLLSDEAVVVGISLAGDGQIDSVITVRASESVLTSVAASGAVHVAKVNGAPQ